METLRYVVLANGLLAVVSLAFYVLLRRETFFSANRLALWLGLASALILPLLELPDWRPQRVRSVMHQTAQVIVPHVLPKPNPPDITITFPNRQTYQAFQTEPKRFVWSWQSGLIAIYLFGVFLLLARFGIQLLSLRKLIHSSVHESYDDFMLVKNELVDSPFSFFNWVVLNPNQHAIEELEQILRHERVHIRERHSYDMLGTELVCIVFWFNPAAYLFRQLIHQTLEFRADYAVLQEGVDAKTYQYNLVKVSLLANSSKITNHFSKSQLKSRIAMLNQEKSSRATWVKYPVFLLAALTIASAFARPKHIQAVNRYVPKPVTETIKAVVELPEQPVQEEKSKPTIEPSVLQTTPVATLSANVVSESVTSKVDSVAQPLKVDSIRSTPFSPFTKNVADTLRLISERTEIEASKLADDQKMENMILEGKRIYGHLGMGFRRFDQSEIQKQSRPNSSVSINSEGYIFINESPAWTTKFFINNQPVTINEVQLLKISQLYTLAVILGYDSGAQKRTKIDYLLFYTN